MIHRKSILKYGIEFDCFYFWFVGADALLALPTDGWTWRLYIQFISLDRDGHQQFLDTK